MPIQGHLYQYTSEFNALHARVQPIPDKPNLWYLGEQGDDS